MSATERFMFLSEVARQGVLSTAKTLLEDGANAHGCDVHGSTPLMWACQGGNTDVVQLLLTHLRSNSRPIPFEVFVSKSDESYLRSPTEVHRADRSKKQSARELINKLNTDPALHAFDVVNRQNVTGLSALMAAVQGGHADVVKLMIAAGADVHRKDNAGYNSVMMACQGGYPEVVKVLMERNARGNECTHAGYTSLMMASQDGQTKCASMLLRYGVHVDLHDSTGSTALMWAAQGGHSHVAELLLKNGASVNSQNQHGSTALFFAAQNGHHNTVSVLLSFDADVGIVDRNSCNALMAACEHGNHACAKLLLKYQRTTSTAINQSDLEGWTALSLACLRSDNSDTVELLLNSGAHPDGTRSPDGDNFPLLVATRSEQTAYCKMLLEAGAQVDLDGHQLQGGGCTALSEAVDGGHEEVARLLIGHDSDVNQRCRLGISVLSRAIAAGHVHLVSLLLANGADVDESPRPPAGDIRRPAAPLEEANLSANQDMQRVLHDTREQRRAHLWTAIHRCTLLPDDLVGEVIKWCAV